MDARVSSQPLLDGGAGVAGQVVANQIEVALWIGLVNDSEELEVANRVARPAVKVTSRPSRTRNAP